MYRVLHQKLMLATQQKALVEVDYRADSFVVGDSGVLVLYNDDPYTPLKAIPPGLWLDVERIEPSDVEGSLVRP